MRKSGKEFSLAVVHFRVVLVRHAVGVELGVDIRHRIEDDVHPLVVVIVVERQNLVVQDVVEVVAVGAVAGFRREMGSSFRNDEAVFPVLGEFTDPAVIGGDGDGAVHGGGHAGGAGGLPGDYGVVQPHVGAVLQVAAQAQFIAGEYGGTGVFGRHVIQAVEDFNGAVVHRVGLAGPDELHRIVGALEHAFKHGGIAGDQVRTLVGRKAARPDDGEAVRVKNAARLFPHHAEEGFFQGALAADEGLLVAGLEGFRQFRVLPVFLVLGVRDVDDGAHAFIVLPHLAGNFAVELGDAVGDVGEAQGGQRVVERVVRQAYGGAHLFHGKPVEEGERVHGVHVHLFIAGFLRSVGGEDEALAHFLHAAGFGKHVEGGGQAMGFVQVVDFRFNAQFVKEAGAALAEQHVLGDAGEAVGVVQAAGNVAAFLVVFLQVRGKEEHGGGAEGFRIQEVGLHPDGRAADVNEEFDVVVFQERVVLAHVLRGHGTVFRPDLVVVAVAPQDADAYEVLPQVVRAAHVGAGQVAQAAGVDFE